MSRPDSKERAVEKQTPVHGPEWDSAEGIKIGAAQGRVPGRHGINRSIEKPPDKEKRKVGMKFDYPEEVRLEGKASNVHREQTEGTPPVHGQTSPGKAKAIPQPPPKKKIYQLKRWSNKNRPSTTVARKRGSRGDVTAERGTRS